MSSSPTIVAPFNPEDIPRNSPRDPEKSATRQVLVVDDEPLIRWWLAESLGARGYAITEAENAAAAVRAVTDHAGHFETVLLDLKLPDSTDLSLLVRLRSMAPRAHFILMTAYGAPEIRSEALELGALDVLDKPFTLEALIALLDGAASGTRFA